MDTRDNINASSFDDLDWLAFRYVANELSADDRVAFERRLANDQLAREAVAEAVELTQTLSAIPALEQLVETRVPALCSASTSPSAWTSWRRAGWIAAGLAACLLVLLALQLGRDGDGSGNQGQEPRASQVAPDQLASAWIETLNEFSAAESDAVFPASIESDNNAQWDFESSLVAVNDEQAMATPDWMLAAVSGLAEEMNSTPTPERGE